MSLLDEIDGALLTVVDREARVVYVWFGGAGVNVYNEDGVEVDYFTIGGPGQLTPARVRTVIERVMASPDD